MNAPLLVPDIPSLTLGRLGVYQLKRYWQKRRLELDRRLDNAAVQAEYALDFTLLHGLGLGIVEPAEFLFHNRPDFEAFEAWIEAQLGGPPAADVVNRLNAMVHRYLETQKRDFPLPGYTGEKVLSEADLAFWQEHGYVVLKNAIPKDSCAATAQLIWDHLGMNPDDPETWYRGEHLFWVSLFQHPQLCANRAARRIHSAFAQLWGTDDLWATVDRSSLNRPERNGMNISGPSNLHWDVSLGLPMPFGVQGLLYLTDTSAEQGAFRCVPGFHHRLADWLAGLAPGANPREQDLEALGPLPIPGEAGDFILWHHALPHGSSRNFAQRPRLVQYISLFPHDYGLHPEWS